MASFMKYSTTPGICRRCSIQSSLGSVSYTHLDGYKRQDVTLAYPEGYEVMDEVVEVAKKNAAEFGGKFEITNDMKQAFQDADVVYPKSWAPFKAMEERTELYGNGDFEGIKALEKRLLAQLSLIHI